MTRKKTHINKIPAPTQSRDNPANLFMFMCFFLSLMFVDFQVPSWVSCFKENSLPPVLPRFLSQSPRFSPGTRYMQMNTKSPRFSPGFLPKCPRFSPGSFGRPRFSPGSPPVLPRFSPHSTPTAKISTSEQSQHILHLTNHSIRIVFRV